MTNQAPTADMTVAITTLAAWRKVLPKVNAYEHAAEIGMHPTALSKYESGERVDLPHSLTFDDYRDALIRLKRRKGATEEQIAPWAPTAAKVGA